MNISRRKFIKSAAIAIGASAVGISALGKESVHQITVKASTAGIDLATHTHGGYIITQKQHDELVSELNKLGPIRRMAHDHLTP